MKVSAVDVICDLVYATELERIKGLDELKRGLEICAELGAPVAHVAGHTPKAGISKDDGHQMIVDGLLSQKDFCRQKTVSSLQSKTLVSLHRSSAWHKTWRDLLKKAKGNVKLVFRHRELRICRRNCRQEFQPPRVVYMLCPHEGLADKPMTLKRKSYKDQTSQVAHSERA
jgi:hypothetical protein